MHRSSLFISALVLLSCMLFTPTTSTCTGPHHLQPCECARSHYSCKTNSNQCTWASDVCSPSTPSTTKPTVPQTSNINIAANNPATSKLTENSGIAAAAKCDADCNALNVKLLYYGKLSEYNTDYIYYDTIYVYDQTTPSQRRRRRRMATKAKQPNPGPRALPEGLVTEGDIVCYTYSIEVNPELNCVPDISSVVLGACDADTNRVTPNDLEALVINEFGGELYSAFNAVSTEEISGINVNVPVRENSKPEEFTLCMKGVNDIGTTSNSVRFNRGSDHLSSYTCSNVANHGLPCLRADFTNGQYLNQQTPSQPQVPETVPIVGAETDLLHLDHDEHHQHYRAPSEVFSTFLFAILLIVLTIMVLVSVFYMCVSHEKSWLHVAVDKYRYKLPAAMWTQNKDEHYVSDRGSAPVTSSDISFSSSSMEFEDDDEENDASRSHPRLPRPKVPDESPTVSNLTSTSSSSLGLGRISIKWSYSAPNLFKFNLNKKRQGIPVERQRLLQEQYMKLYQEDELEDLEQEQGGGNLLGRAVDEFTDDGDDENDGSDDSVENLHQSIKAIERQVVREMNERLNSFKSCEMQDIPESPHEEIEQVEEALAEIVQMNSNENANENDKEQEQEDDEAKQEEEEEEKDEILHEQVQETPGNDADEDSTEIIENNDNAASVELLGSPDLVESTSSSRRLSSVTASSDDRGTSGDGTVMLPEYSQYDMVDAQQAGNGGGTFYARFADDDVGHTVNDVGSPPDVANTGLTVNVINAMRYHATTPSTDFFD